MKEDKLNTLLKVSSVIMVLLGVASIVSGCWIIYVARTFDPDISSKTSLYLLATASIYQALAMWTGAAYFLKGHGKRAAGFYRAFIVFVALSLIWSVLLNISAIYDGTAAGAGSNVRVILRLVILAGISALLVMLALAKNLGKRNTWMIYGVVFALSIVFMGLSLVDLPSVDAASAAVGVICQITRLFIIGAVGLAIRARYADQDARLTY